MTTTNPDLFPSGLFHFFDKLLAAHDVYHTHHYKNSKYDNNTRNGILRMLGLIYVIEFTRKSEAAALQVALNFNPVWTSFVKGIARAIGIVF